MLRKFSLSRVKRAASVSRPRKAIFLFSQVRKTENKLPSKPREVGMIREACLRNKLEKFTFEQGKRCSQLRLPLLPLTVDKTRGDVFALGERKEDEEGASVVCTLDKKTARTATTMDA